MPLPRQHACELCGSVLSFSPYSLVPKWPLFSTKLTKTTTVRPENALRRVCIIAGDISPIDVITPLPVLCEDNDIPYVYVPSKEVRL